MKTLEIILSLVDYFFRQWHEQKRQKERDELEANPAAWFESHFDGVRNDKTD